MQNSALAEEYVAQSLVGPGGGAERAASAFSPFVIGVTGHRDLAEGDLARARSAVRSFFDTIRQLLPDTELNVDVTPIFRSHYFGSENLPERTTRGVGLVRALLSS